MNRVLKAALLYFFVVFTIAFMLGGLRLLWVVPHLGTRTAELLELPILLLVSVLAARRIVRLFEVDASIGERLAMGFVAMALVLLWDFTLVLWLRGLSLDVYFATLDPVTGAAYYATLALYGLMPLFVPPAIPRARYAALAGAAAVLMIAGAVVYLSYEADVRVERARVGQGSAMAQTACGPIEYAALGQGPAVLIVHGAGGGFDQMLDMARELANTGFRALTVSRFGYLRTPLPADASPAAQADAHACLLDALSIDRAAVIGISAGAPSSMQFALRHPDRLSALVLLVPLAYAPREPAAPISASKRFLLERAVRSDFLYWAMMTLQPDLVTGTILGTPPELLRTADLDERARVRTLMRRILPISRRHEGLLNEAAVAASLPRYELERIEAPTLLISAQDDRYDTYVAARYSAAHMPNARFLGYRTGGHMLVGHQADVTALIRDFLGGSPPLGLAP